MKKLVKKIVVRLLPLAARKRLAIWINRSPWLNSSDRAYWATELLTDFAQQNRNEYHKFLWANHLAYAETYEIEQRFGYEKLNETRKLFFSELPMRLLEARLAADDIESVLEVGCSLGYLLRHIETDIFPTAQRYCGIDIDGHAIAKGRAHLKTLGSRVELRQGDMVEMARTCDERSFDFVLGSGVLLYLDQPAAEQLVAAMLRVTRRMLVFTALANPDRDNAELDSSVPRDRDGTWIHNVDRMIESGGGEIIARRWEGGRVVDGNTVYFLYAVPKLSKVGALG